jgi:hypothetical protein
LFTVLIAAALAIVGLRPVYPLAFKIGIFLVSGWLLWLLVKWFWVGSRRMVRIFANRRLVTAEYIRLVEFFERFKPFADPSDGRSIRNLLLNASRSGNITCTRLIETEYMRAWLESFAEQLRYQPGNVAVLMARCREFSRLVTEFNYNYPIRAQAALEQEPPFPYTPHFEQFRDDFNAYLRDCEQWASSVASQFESRLPHSDWLRLVPCRIYDRVKPFVRDKAAAVAT